MYLQTIKNKMKIARIYSNFQVDLKYTEHYLARELRKNGHKTTFITSDKYLKAWEPYLKNLNGAGYYQYENYDVFRLKSIMVFGKTIIINLKKFKSLLFNSKFDILHLYGLGTFTTMIVLWSCVLFRKHNFPIIISDHTDTRTHSREGLFAELYYFIFRVQLIFLKSRILRVVSFSNVGLNVLSKRFKLQKNKFDVIPLGYDQDNYKFDSYLKNKSKKFIIGYAGKISSSKRVDFLIKTLDELDLKKKLKLIIVGYNKEDKYCQSLSELADKVDFEIEFRPFADSENLAEFYNYIDLAIYPGGVSITTIEASGSGTPIIIYRSIDGLEERVQFERGKLFQTKEELKTHLKYYFELYQKNGIDNEHISIKTKENFSWEKVSKQYYKLYKEAINEK
jgi:glycosyltransferase involved in cell wall biosynthesis